MLNGREREQLALSSRHPFTCLCHCAAPQNWRISKAGAICIAAERRQSVRSVCSSENSPGANLGSRDLPKTANRPRRAYRKPGLSDVECATGLPNSLRCATCLDRHIDLRGNCDGEHGARTLVTYRFIDRIEPGTVIVLRLNDRGYGGRFEKVHLRMRTISPIAPMFSNMSTLTIDKLQTAKLAFVDFGFLSRRANYE